MAKFPERSPSSSVLSGVGFLSKACFFAGEYEMTDPRRLATYRGKKIEDMAREELIEALQWAADRIQQTHEDKMRWFSFLHEIREARRG